MRRKCTVLLTLLMVFASGLLYAGTTGKLMGRVKDSNGKPIEMASVFLLKAGTSTPTGFGANTEANGQYIIINLPPGTYDVMCQLIGFSPAKITGIRINVDETTTQNFTMTKQLIEGEVVEFKAKQELVTKDAASGSSFTAEKIESVAVTNIEGLIAMKAGAVNTGGELHVRGGRANEVQYTVDGMSVSDPVDGGSALSVDMDAIADMKVYAGGLTAEYGNAQSGMVNIVTKSGSSDYSGKVEVSSDHLFEDADNTDEFKFNLGGPVLGNLSPSLRKNFTFFFNMGANWSDGAQRSLYKSDANKDFGDILLTNYNSYNPYKDRDNLFSSIFDNFSDFTSMKLNQRNFNDYNANLKMKYAFSPVTSISFAVRGDGSLSTPYAHSWRYALDHYYTSRSKQQQYVAEFDHTLTETLMNIKVKASYFTNEVKSGPMGINRKDYFQLAIAPGVNPDTLSVGGIYYLDEDYNNIMDWGYPDDDSWEYQTDNGTGEAKPLSDYFRTPGSFYGAYRDNKTETYSLRGDVEWQYSSIHGFKSGFEVIKYTIRKDEVNNMSYIDPLRYNQYLNTVTPVDTVVAVGDTTKVYYYSATDRLAASYYGAGTADGYKAEPWQGAFYVQDRMDYEGMVVNAGLRFDFWYLGGDYKINTASMHNKSYLDSLKPDDTVIEGSDEWKSAMSYYRKIKDKFEKPKVILSPRLGISHPISETDVVHFVYNYQNQLPQMAYIFQTTRPRDMATSTTTNAVVGNPELDPQITITYEVGLQHQFNDTYVMDITAYYKNIYNYVSLKKEEDKVNSLEWYKYVSENYGSVKGVNLNLDRMLTNYVSNGISYSLTWANGNQSDIPQDEKVNLREFPLNWDIRHTVNYNVEYHVGKDEEAPIQSLLDFLVPLPEGYSLSEQIDSDINIPFDDFAINFNYSIATGSPYTPTTKKETGDINSKRMDTTHSADLKITKNFSLTDKIKTRFYCTITNLFNTRNIINVNTRTGNPTDDNFIYEDTNDYVSPEQLEVFHKALVNAPGWYSDPRSYNFGVSINF